MCCLVRMGGKSDRKSDKIIRTDQFVPQIRAAWQNIKAQITDICLFLTNHYFWLKSAEHNLTSNYSDVIS